MNTKTPIPGSPTPTPVPFTSVSAKFTYDGDGRMVKSVIDGVTTLYVGAHYEVTNPGAGQAVTKYYPGGAMRVGTTLYYLLSDHLGSTSIMTNSTGAKVSELRYKAWGDVRYNSGAIPYLIPHPKLPGCVDGGFLYA